MKALEQIVADLEWYANKIEASHLAGTVQVSPMTPQPPGRSLADARPDTALLGSSAGLETDGSDGSSADGPRKRASNSRDSSPVFSGPQRYWRKIHAAAVASGSI